MNHLPLATLLGLLLWSPGNAWSYTTRIHISLANELRDSLQGDTIPLQGSDRGVVLPHEDAQAIANHPLEFRAGSIAPDDLVFPAMTDPSHAIGMRPFDQCELLYQAAITEEERAFALGCFVHGATDAVGHHFVNFLTGETFTLNPITADRGSDYSNAIRHIIAESLMQAALLGERPDLFTSTRLAHSIPRGFVDRTYMNDSSELWGLLATHARPKLDSARAANPNLALYDVVQAAGLAPAEHLVLLPIYQQEIDLGLDDLKLWLEMEIERMQDPNDVDGADLLPLPGPDGMPGTGDDETDCAWTCPYLYGSYFGYIGLLAPRYDAGGNPLPSAFDKIADDLRLRLGAFDGAYLDTVENLSVLLAGPLDPSDDAGFSFSQAQVQAAFAPMTAWADSISNIDYATLSQAVSPQWLQDLENFISFGGLGYSVTDIVRAVFEPYVQEIRQLYTDLVIDIARGYIDDLRSQYSAMRASVEAEYQQRLEARNPADLSGTLFDHLTASGLWMGSFNLAAATLANRSLMLPDGDSWAGHGPASFDSSYTLAWSQAQACSYLAKDIFPFGADLQGLLSLQVDGQEHRAQVGDDPAIECHDGSLSAFTETPDALACELVELDVLVEDSAHRGSLSRAFPPSVVGDPVQCQDTEVDGLELPPVGDPEDGATACQGCSTQEGRGSTPWLFALLFLATLGLRRSSVWDRMRRGLPLLLLLGVAGCASISEDDDASVSPGDDDATPTPSGRDLLLQSLGNSSWWGTAQRDGRSRQVQLEFRAADLMLGELVNPWGPARHRRMRAFVVSEDGSTLDTTVVTPNGWELPADNGETENWKIEILETQPLTLQITRADSSIELYQTGTVPAPSTGLTAEVRAFGDGSVVDLAFCQSGWNGFDYPTLFSFARGGLPAEELSMDRVAGAHLMTWNDSTGNNLFAVTDVEGFATHGGTFLSEQRNFMVRYTGVVHHPGGTLAMREADDVVEDALWVFLEAGVGSSSAADLFLEVQGFPWPDETVDDPAGSFLAGDLPIEIIVVRCAVPISPIDAQISLVSAPFQLVGLADTAPALDGGAFPALF